MCCCNDRVGKELSEISQFRQPGCPFFYIFISLIIRIHRTSLNVMSKLLTAHAPCFFHVLSLIELFISVIFLIIIVFFTLMLLELAPRLFFTNLTATPPHVYIFTLKHISMGSTTPVHVVLFMELFRAVFTYLNT